MEHKTWVWKKKSSEKTILMREKSDLLVEKERALILERSLQDLNKQLSFARTESDVKDDLLTKQATVAEEAIAGWEKAEAEAILFKQQLDDTFQQKAVAEERMAKTIKTLEDCTQQLQARKKEQEYIIFDATKKISREQENARALEEKLAEATRNIAKLNIENTNLCRILEMKEKVIKELNESQAKVEASFTEVRSRLDSTEKQNVSLKYEICMLQKELEIRNKEREYNLKSADAAYKQQAESIKKITKLEAECQRLRLMVRKRLPGPAALAKMKSEVELLNSTETRKKRIDFASRNHHDAHQYGSSIPEKIHELEDENIFLKESLSRKNNELQSLQLMFAHTSSELSQCERRLGELSERQACFDVEKSGHTVHEKPSTISEYGNEDNVSCAESWASALISELEHFKSGKPTAPSNLSFVDDYLEMEKHASSKEVAPIVSKSCETTKQSDFGADLSETTGKELVLVGSKSDDLQTLVEKLIQEIEGMIQRCMKDHDGQLALSGSEAGTPVEQKPTSPTGYVALAFLWETSKLSAVLQRFVHACKDILCGKADLESFVYEVSLALEWIVHHSLSLQESDNWEHIKYAGQDVSQLNSNFKFLTYNPSSQTDKINEHNEPKMEIGHGVSGTGNETPITHECQHSGDDASDYQEEVQVAKECEGSTKDQTGNKKEADEDLRMPLAASVVEITGDCQELSPPVVELGKENGFCEEMEPKCLQSELKLESAITNGSQKFTAREEKQLRTDSELAAAVEKLAECQETIINLGKQLKALVATPKDTPPVDRTTTSPAKSTPGHRSQSLYQVLAAEDAAESNDPVSPKSEGIACTEPQDQPAVAADLSSNTRHDVDESPKVVHLTPQAKPPRQQGAEVDAMMALALNPKRRKGGVNLLRKLIFRREKESSNKLITLPDSC